MMRIAANNLFGFRNVLRCSTAVQFSNTSTAVPKPNRNPQNLPHLPVPKLDDTLQKFLRSVKPFLSNEEYNNSERIVKEFRTGLGPELHKYIEEKAKSEENWLEDWWLNSAYLDFRSSVVVYSSPGLIFPFQKFKTENDAIAYAAKLILGGIDFKLMVDNGRIVTEKMGKAELDMAQYGKVIGTCRIPGPQRDALQFNPTSNYIIVAYNNHFIKLEPFVGNEFMNEDQLIDQLTCIVDTYTHPADPIGILSADHRDSWATSYAELIKDPENKKSVEEIQKCMFLVCLDGPMPSDESASRLSVAGEQFIHGGGSRFNAGNRWYDKTIQFVIGIDGCVGLTYEHSPSEGQPIAVMADHFVNYMNANKSQGLKELKTPKKPTKLKFNVSSKTHDDIKKCGENLDKLVNDFEMVNFKFTNYGKDFVKTQKMSPDSYIQMAMQLAFYRLHRTPGAHYESAATRKYVHGRTETIRSCSIESIKFAQTMLNNKASSLEKVNALRAAVLGHKNYSVEAVHGFGCDRHMLGMKLAALEKGYSVPAIFEDVAFTRSANMRMSTSQVATRCDGLMAYGPLVPDGYACCYNPRPNDINFGVSAFRAARETSAEKFKQTLEQSLMEMKDILLDTAQHKSKL